MTAAMAAASASILLGALPLPPLAAQAITNEQLVYLEAWRAVDRAYVDKTFNGNSWFRVCFHPHRCYDLTASCALACASLQRAAQVSACTHVLSRCREALKEASMGDRLKV